ncbi:hypothetical protein EJ02DRAFT_419687 [Clathrospora elynae]|uniref:Uncharacterized protein n=1 Tax=Clathrospora elynae TaxID=706981 RepID=A0A6A5SYU7_9PLEO|nr:hypothetical protein EJ02DRAFT_419687 [Clathrospora elynae]
MEAIKGAKLADPISMIRIQGPWGALFICHLFGLEKMGLICTGFNANSIMFRYKHDPGLNELPQLILTHNSRSLDICSRAFRGSPTRTFIISEAVQLPRSMRKSRKFDKVPAYDAKEALEDEADKPRTSNAPASSINSINTDIMKVFEHPLKYLASCTLELGDLGNSSGNVIEEVVGNRPHLTAKQ